MSIFRNNEITVLNSFNQGEFETIIAIMTQVECLSINGELYSRSIALGILADRRIRELKIEVRSIDAEELFETLHTYGVPYFAFFPSKKIAFFYDGVKGSSVNVNEKGEPIVLASVVDNIIGMLEEDKDIEALVYANENSHRIQIGELSRMTKSISVDKDLKVRKIPV